MQIKGHLHVMGELISMWGKI